MFLTKLANLFNNLSDNPDIYSLTGFYHPPTIL